MGYDLYGANDVNFHNNLLVWEELWDYVCEVCHDILTLEDKRAALFNDCHEIDEDKAKQIADRLFSLIESGKLQQYADEYDSEPDTTDSWTIFNVENVKAFAKFCRRSGGFKVC